MKKTKRLTLKDIDPSHFYIQGWEIRRNQYSEKIEWEIGRWLPSDVRKLARFYIKGLKKLLKSANTKGAFESMGEVIHGNTNTVLDKFNKLQIAAGHNNIIEIGQGKDFTITSYVDGSYSLSLI